MKKVPSMKETSKADKAYDKKEMKAPALAIVVKMKPTSKTNKGANGKC